MGIITTPFSQICQIQISHFSDSQLLKWDDHVPVIVLDRVIVVDITKAAKSPEDLVGRLPDHVQEVLNVTAVEMDTAEANATVTAIDITKEIVDAQVPIQIPPVQTQIILAEKKFAVFH